MFTQNELLLMLDIIGKRIATIEIDYSTDMISHYFDLQDKVKKIVLKNFIEGNL